MSSARRVPFAVVCLLWAGILLGVSLAETVKFRTPTLSRSVAADIGRTVFRASHWVQFGLVVLAVVSAAAGRVPRWAVFCLAVVGATLLFQGAVLFPLLDARAQTIVEGAIPKGHSPHAVYGVLEVLKLLALVGAALLALLLPKEGRAA